NNPENETGFLCFQCAHWLAVRKLGRDWYLLNSISEVEHIPPQPVRLSEFYLRFVKPPPFFFFFLNLRQNIIINNNNNNNDSALLMRLQDKGFQMFVVRGDWPSLGREAPQRENLVGSYVYYNCKDICGQTDLAQLQTEIRQQKLFEKRQKQLQQCAARDNEKTTIPMENRANSLPLASTNMSGQSQVASSTRSNDPIYANTHPTTNANANPSPIPTVDQRMPAQLANEQNNSQSKPLLRRFWNWLIESEPDQRVTKAQHPDTECDNEKCDFELALALSASELSSNSTNNQTRSHQPRGGRGERQAGDAPRNEKEKTNDAKIAQQQLNKAAELNQRNISEMTFDEQMQLARELSKNSV
ncbi:hypothetical protein RFI_03280, partial [Reticulomyxa filosa]